MEKAIAVDDFTGQEVCSIDFNDLPRVGDHIVLIESDDYVSYFKVKEIIFTAPGAQVLMIPTFREWALGFNKLHGRSIHFLFAQGGFHSFQKNGVL